MNEERKLRAKKARDWNVIAGYALFFLLFLYLVFSVICGLYPAIPMVVSLLLPWTGPVVGLSGLIYWAFVHWVILAPGPFRRSAKSSLVLQSITLLVCCISWSLFWQFQQPGCWNCESHWAIPALALFWVVIPVVSTFLALPFFSDQQLRWNKFVSWCLLCFCNIIFSAILSELCSVVAITYCVVSVSKY